MTSPSILALDTATDTCSVALLWRGAIVDRSERVGQKHSERALPMVDEVLTAAGISLREVDYLAFGAGPGSFTGLRIACGVVQGLAWGAGKRVIAVGNLQALAARAFDATLDCQTVLCAIDARMNEAYCAIYRRSDIPLEVEPAALAGPLELAELAAKVDAVAGDALKVFPDSFPAASRALRFPDLRADAGDIVRLASSAAMIASAVAPDKALPLYVRDRVAMTTEERRARSTVR
jgi:tRNA threonylcarbamoyladenosine biosynthesis protein TsaB